jgi:farnesyl diphosphate synthase
MSAINDGVLLKCHVQAIIKRYFKEKFYFLDLMELWNEVIGGPEQTQNLLGFHL